MGTFSSDVSGEVEFMAERKSGPVKPPVIDLTARPAGKPEVPAEPAAKSATATVAPSKVTPASKPTPEAGSSVASTKTADSKPAAEPTPAKAGAASPEAAKPTSTADFTHPAKPSSTPPPPPRRGNSWVASLACGIGGAIVATAVCYELASFGYWPGRNDTRLAALDSRLATVEKSATDLDARFSTLQTNVAAKLAAAASSLTAMQAGVDKLQTSGGDLGAIRDQLKTLSARVDAVAAGASSADAGAIAANLSTAQQALTALTQKVSALGDRAGATDNVVAALKAELAAAKAAIDQAAAAPSPKTIAAAMQLPLLISALDADFAAGRPYADDLKALQSAVPEAKVPASITAAATTGLPAAADVVSAFEARMPDIMAAEPPSTDSSWQGQLGDWMKGVLALRQESAQPGDGPGAVLSRLEAAVNRHDFAGALALLGQLPQPMQQAAGDVSGKLQLLADTDTFIADLRHKALAPAGGNEQ
jgi:hypothetical protein